MIDLLWRHAVRRHEDKDVANVAREQTVLPSGFTDAKTDPFTNRESFASSEISHQFDRTNHPFATNIPDIGMLPEALRGGVQVRAELVAVRFGMRSLQ